MGLFGLIPLATTISNYMAIVTNAFNHSVARFLTVALEKGDLVDSNRIFNSSLFCSIALALLLAVPAVLLAFFADLIVDVPQGHERDTRLLFAFAGAVFLLNTVATPFSVSTFCRNRFDLRNLITISFNLARIGLVVLIFQQAAPAIWQVGLALLLATFLSFGGAVAAWRHLTPALRISPTLLRPDTLKSLGGTGGWVLLTQIGSVLLLSIDLLIVNRVLGAEAAGRYAPILQWSLILRTVASTLSGVFAPNIMGFYAREEIPGLVDYACRAIKFIGLTLALPIGIVCGLASPLLTAWLGSDFADLAPLLVILVAPLVINLAVLPLFPVLLSANAVRLPGLVTLGLGIVNVALAITLAGPAGLGVYGVAIAGVSVLTLKNLCFIPLYAARKLDQGMFTFLRRVGPVALGAVFVFVLARLTSASASLDSWISLAFAASAIAPLYALFVYFLLLDRNERATAREMLSRIPLVGNRKGDQP